MSDPQFDVVLKGILPGFESHQVQTGFAALFSLDEDKVARLFAAKRAVLKSGVSQEIADKYIARLAALGVDAIAEARAVDIPLSLEPMVTSAEQQEPEQGQGFSQSLESAPLQASVKPSYSTYSDPVSDQPTKQRHQFVFKGRGFEYFKIWIVNILLSIVTLGIYSAWAKVRNKQYFYGNTRIAGSTFEYTAEPIKILKGRVIAFLLYIALSFSGHISPLLSLVMALLFLAFLPWIIVASLRFNARHTTYRNIAFRFNGSVGGALAVFVGWPLLGILSFGLLFPFVWKKQAAYVTNNHSYGAEPFNFDVHVKEYYMMLLVLIGGSIAFFVVFAMLVGGAAMGAILTGGGDINPAAFLSMIPLVLLYIAFYFALGAYVVVTMANIHWNNTKLDDHQFTSNWSVFSYMGLIVTNTLGILLTLGLFVPFAKVRAAAYKAGHTALVVSGDLDGFIADKLEESNSLAEGVHDIFDIDISI